MKVIITAPSLDPSQNVSGVSSVANFIIDNNPSTDYIHFELGKKDKEKGGIHRINSILTAVVRWFILLKKQPESIIHYSFPLSAPSILRDPVFMYIARLMHKRMTIHIHGGVFLTAEKIPFFLETILKWVFSWNSTFIVLSESEKEILHNRWNVQNVVVLPNCVDLRDSVNFSREYNVLTPLRIGFLGRIEPNKGMTELLEACKILKNEKVKFVLDIAGKEATPNQYLPLFHNELGDSFHYSGVVSGNTKCNYLRGLDLFVLPSYFEGLPMSLLECMSYGTVPVITPVGSIPQVIRDGENGLFIKDHDVESIVETIKKIDLDRTILCYFGNNAKSTIFEHFSPQSYIDKLNAVYKSL